MIPAACVPISSSPKVSRAAEGVAVGGTMEGTCCPNCGQEITEFPRELLEELEEKISAKHKRLSQLKEEIVQVKRRWSDLLETKQRLACQWNRVLRARCRVSLLKRGCEMEGKWCKRDMEELQLLTKTNSRRRERLRRVGSKDFAQKEKGQAVATLQEKQLLEEKMSEVVALRQQFIAGLYRRVFPIEVLPLSHADAGDEDYSERAQIDCDSMLDLEGGWVLGGVHCHPTPHISIVAPSLPVDGDHTPYLRALAERAKSKEVLQDTSLHPFNDPYSSVPAALSYITHFVEVIAWVLDQPLPYPLPRHVAISEYGNPVKRRRVFLKSLAKLDDNIIYLCFTQNVPPSALAPGHTLQNLLALVTHSQLGRTGSFECHPELASYRGESSSSRRALTSKVSPLLHDADDSQPPTLSYTTDTCNLEDSEEEEEGEGEGEKRGERVVEEEEGSKTSLGEQMDWEHLEPSIEETLLFEEEQMRQALLSAAAAAVASPSPSSSPSSSSTLSSERHRHAQEVEIYRQKLCRLDYDSTYKDYAAMKAAAAASSGSGTVTTSSSSSVGGVSSSSSKSLGLAVDAGEDHHLQGQKTSSPAETTAPAQPLTSGFLSTLGSLWTSTFGGSK